MTEKTKVILLTGLIINKKNVFLLFSFTAMMPQRPRYEQKQFVHQPTASNDQATCFTQIYMWSMLLKSYQFILIQLCPLHLHT